jgi:hypothetical protein
VSQVYNSAEYKLLNGDIRFISDPIWVLLVTQGFSFNSQHVYVADVLANEAEGTNYSRKLLTGKARSIDNLTDTAIFSANNPTWSRINVGNLAGAIVYKFVSNDGDSELVAFFGFAKLTTGGDLTVKWNDNGIFRLRNG